MTYNIDKALAQKQHDEFQTSYKKAERMDWVGITMSAVGLLTIIAVNIAQLPDWTWIAAGVLALLGMFVVHSAGTTLRSNSIPARFVELEQKYKLLDFKHQRIDEGIDAGYRRITVMTEDEEGNVSERYLGKAKSQYNTRYKEITLDINKAILYFPYPPEE
ncbi:MAG: hypothetical protein IJZ68_09365 [Bacteroidaceae bacterium]|nr:hypothetical protein [Bacteroidaceae bacterium]